MPLFQLKNHLSETGIFFFFFWNWELSFWTRYLKPYGQSSILSDPIPLKGNAFHIPPKKKKCKRKQNLTTVSSAPWDTRAIVFLPFAPLISAGRPGPGAQMGKGGVGWWTHGASGLKEHLGVGQGCTPRLWSSPFFHFHFSTPQHFHSK